MTQYDAVVVGSSPNGLAAAIAVAQQGGKVLLIEGNATVGGGMRSAEVTLNTVYMAEAGPVPHNPETGKVVAFGPESSTATEVAAGALLLVDVEYGRCGTVYALSQGNFEEGGAPGSPAQPNTGSLLKVNWDGTFTVIMDKLNQPTSLEFIGNTAYVVTLTGEIWKIGGVPR